MVRWTLNALPINLGTSFSDLFMDSNYVTLLLSELFTKSGLHSNVFMLKWKPLKSVRKIVIEASTHTLCDAHTIVCLCFESPFLIGRCWHCSCYSKCNKKIFVIERMRMSVNAKHPRKKQNKNHNRVVIMHELYT